ncbi:hypothetical protein FQR65_LT03314 [Abscondita terminalis]|nr:hypothetical protein FQR65_LT03314 [Abscondita terminalis]
MKLLLIGIVLIKTALSQSGCYGNCQNAAPCGGTNCFSPPNYNCDNNEVVNPTKCEPKEITAPSLNITNEKDDVNITTDIQLNNQIINTNQITIPVKIETHNFNTINNIAEDEEPSKSDDLDTIYLPEPYRPPIPYQNIPCNAIPYQNNCVNGECRKRPYTVTNTCTQIPMYPYYQCHNVYQDCARCTNDSYKNCETYSKCKDCFY